MHGGCGARTGELGQGRVWAAKLGSLQVARGSERQAEEPPVEERRIKNSAAQSVAGRELHVPTGPLALLPDMTCVCVGLSHPFPAPGSPFGGSASRAGSAMETGNTEWPHLPSHRLGGGHPKCSPSPREFSTYPANQHLEGHLTKSCPCHQHCGRTAYPEEKGLV